MGSERRQTPRFNVALQVRFKDLRDLQTEEIKNLSRGGALVLTRAPLPGGARVPITLIHPVTREELDILAEVKRAEPAPGGGWALGVQFVDFSPALKLKIHDFVDSITRSSPAETAAPKAAGDTQAARKLAEYLGQAATAESSNSWSEVARYLDLALAVAPDRADVHAWRARILAERLNQKALAAVHAKHAAEIDPTNESYARMAREYVPPPPKTVAPEAPPPAEKTMPRRSFLPQSAGEWAVATLAIAGFAGIVGYNVWALVLSGTRGGPKSVDPSPYQHFVPLASLKIDGTRAYGVVKPEWSGDDREQNVAGLALALAPLGVTDLFLTNEKAKIVATSRRGATKVY
jgi:hypothetical protein